MDGRKGGWLKGWMDRLIEERKGWIVINRWKEGRKAGWREGRVDG